MALVKYGAVVTELSGKVSGMTFSNVRGAAYLKRVGSYTVSKEVPSLSARFQFAVAASAWNVLSQAQQQVWRDEAAVTPFTDRFGNGITITGFNLFQQINVPRVHAGLPVSPTPTPPIAPPPTFLERNGISLLEWQVANEGFDPDFNVVLFYIYRAGLPTAQDFAQLQEIATIPAASSTPGFDFLPYAQSSNSPPLEGSFSFIAALNEVPSSGLRSAPSFVTFIVAASTLPETVPSFASFFEARIIFNSSGSSTALERLWYGAPPSSQSFPPLPETFVLILYESAASSSGSQNLRAEYSDLFGSPAEGQYMYIASKLYDPATPRYSDDFNRISVLVTSPVPDVLNFVTSITATDWRIGNDNRTQAYDQEFWAAPAQPPGVVPVWSDYQSIRFFNAGSIPFSYNIINTYTAVFGTPASGTVIFVGSYYQDQSNDRWSPTLHPVSFVVP